MKVGVAGLGFMGAMHLNAWRAVGGADVTAVMSSSPEKLAGDLSNVGGNLSDLPETFDFTGYSRYTTLEDLLDDPSIDIVDICLPTYLHVDSAVAALRAGKHVFLEKPLALNSGRAHEVVREAEASGKKFMVGQVLRFFPAYAAAARLLRGQSPVRSAFFRRRAGAPTWNNWLTDPLKSGGAILDFLIHDIDYCVSVWGVPASVRCTGHEDLANSVDICHAVLTYPEMGPVIVTGGWHHPKSYPFSMEFTILTDEGTLDWKSGGELKQYLASGEQQTLPLVDDDPFAAELAYFVGCVARDQTPDRCPPEQSSQAIAIAEMLRQSRKNHGEEILWKA